jgi:hypothetical protein
VFKQNNSNKNSRCVLNTCDTLPKTVSDYDDDDGDNNNNNNKGHGKRLRKKPRIF